MVGRKKAIEVVSESDSEGSEAESESYVVEKIVNKRFRKVTLIFLSSLNLISIEWNGMDEQFHNKL